jgi:hypothetical protein
LNETYNCWKAINPEESAIPITTDEGPEGAALKYGKFLEHQEVFFKQPTSVLEVFVRSVQTKELSRVRVEHHKRWKASIVGGDH